VVVWDRGREDGERISLDSFEFNRPEIYISV